MLEEMATERAGRWPSIWIGGNGPQNTEGNDGVNALGNDRKNPVLVSDIGEDD